MAGGDAEVQGELGRRSVAEGSSSTTKDSCQSTKCLLEISFSHTNSWKILDKSRDKKRRSWIVMREEGVLENRKPRSYEQNRSCVLCRL